MRNKRDDIGRPTGYSTPEEGEPGINKDGRLVADVYYNGKKSCRLFSRIQNLKGIIENKEDGYEIEIYWYGIKEKKTRRSSSVGKIQR